MSDQEFGDYTPVAGDPKPGPFLAKVVSNYDPSFMGILEVEILKPVGGSNSESQLHQVKYHGICMETDRSKLVKQHPSKN